MFNVETCYINPFGKVIFYDYLFVLPSSGNISRYDSYKVEYDEVLEIYRVFETQTQKPIQALWDECQHSTFWTPEQKMALNPYGVRSAVTGITKTNPDESERADTPNSLNSCEEDTVPASPVTPITPFSPLPEESFSEVDLEAVKLSSMTNALDLAAPVNKENTKKPTEPLNLEIHRSDHELYKERVVPPSDVPAPKVSIATTTQETSSEQDKKAVPMLHKVKQATSRPSLERVFRVPCCAAIRKGLAGPSPLRTCQSASGSIEKVSKAPLLMKIVGRKEVYTITWDNKSCKVTAEYELYKTKPQTPGCLSEFVHLGSDDEVESAWSASRLSIIPPHEHLGDVKKLKNAVWHWHQICCMTRQMRQTGDFVPPRLTGIDGDIEEYSLFYHPNNDMGDGYRFDDLRRFINTSRNTMEQQEILHHYNYLCRPMTFRTYTPPEVSLWASYQIKKPRFRNESRKAVTVTQAWKLVDPFYYHGSPELLSLRGSSLTEAVSGLVDKVYEPFGTWGYDDFHFDKTRPRCSLHVPCFSNLDNSPHLDMPQQSVASEPREAKTVIGENEVSQGSGPEVQEPSRDDPMAVESQTAQEFKHDEEGAPRVCLSAPKQEEQYSGDSAVAPGQDAGPEHQTTAQEFKHVEEGALQVIVGAPIHEEQPSSDIVDAFGQDVGLEHQTTVQEFKHDEETTSKVSHIALKQDEQSSQESGTADGQQTGPEHQTTASSAAEPNEEESYGDYLEESFQEEDIVRQSTPPEQASPFASSTSPSTLGAPAEESSPAPTCLGGSIQQDDEETRFLPAPIRTFAGIAAANAFVDSLQRGASQEELQLLQAKHAEVYEGSNSQPYVPDSDDEEEAVDHTGTWSNPNSQPAVQNPVLQQYMENSNDRAAQEEVDALVENAQELLPSTTQEEVSSQPESTPSTGESFLNIAPAGSGSSPTPDNLEQPSEPEAAPAAEHAEELRTVTVSMSEGANEPQEQFVEPYSPTRPLLGFDYEVGTSDAAPQVPVLSEEEKQRQMELDARETAELQKLCNPDDDVEGYASAHNGEEPVGPSADAQSPAGDSLLDSEHYDSDASSTQLQDCMGMGALEATSPSSSDYEERAEELLRLSRNLQDLSDDELVGNLSVVSELIEGIYQQNTPEKKSGSERLGAVIASAEVALGMSIDHRRGGDLDEGIQGSELEANPVWLEYMEERAAVESFVEEGLPRLTEQHSRVSMDESPVEEEVQKDSTWLEYLTERANIEFAFEEGMRREEAEREAEEAARQRQAQNERILLDWLQETAAIETPELGQVERERRTRAATADVLAQFSDVSDIPASTPTFAEYFCGSLALSVGAMVSRMPFVIPC